MRATFDDIRPTRLIEQPRRRLRRKRGVSPGLAAVVAILFAAALVLLSGRDPLPSAPGPIAAAPPPDWNEIGDPLQLFDLSAPELVRLPHIYVARRHRLGGRQDVLTFGQLDGRSPFFRLMLYRVGQEKPEDASLFVDLVRLAATGDVSVIRSSNPAILPTRFGPLETADVDLIASADPVPCLGFRGAGLDGNFRLSGFACGSRTQPISRPALGCLIDRLELDGGGDDSALADYFAETELRRDPSCTGTALGPNRISADWIDENDAPPPLRLRKMR
ncbi:MAG TPA: hypothetical protein VGB93_00775 [Methylovirgula sp.]